MNTKAKGNRQEHRTIALLEDQGYACCRAAASLGLWDIIAISERDTLLIQVKSNRNPRSPEMAALKEFKNPPSSRKLLYVWKDRQKDPVVTEL